MVINSVNFGSTDHFYKRVTPEKEVRSVVCTTKMFRSDLYWFSFIDFLSEHFKNSDKVNVLNYACSDGSEPYSLAILLNENLAKQNSEKFFPIKAYDYNYDIISNAKDGAIRLNSDEIRSLSLYCKNYSDYFHVPQVGYPDSEGELNYFCLATDKIKNYVQFEQKEVLHGLRELPDETKDTLFMCRNMFPYLSSKERKEFLSLVCQKLGKGSVLVMGSFDMSHLGQMIEGYLTKNGFRCTYDNSNYIYVKQ